MYTFENILNILTGESHAHNSEFMVRDLSVDTRKFNNGKNVLFFAISGQNNDAHQYLKEAYEKGCRNFILEKSPDDWLSTGQIRDSNILRVQHAVNALQSLAAHHRRQFNIPVIGITGSNGKTIVKEWLYQLLYRDMKILRSPRSYNSQIGVPLSVWELTGDYETAVFEAGISRPGEMANLERVISPTIGIFTNIGQAHQEGFHSLEEKVLEKLTLFKHCQKLIYPLDYPEIHKAVRKQSEAGYFQDPDFKTVTWSKTSDKADLQLTDIEIGEHEAALTAKQNAEIYQLTLPYTDKASIENAVHCFTTGLMLNVPYPNLQEGLKHLAPVEMRLETVKGINNCTVVNDTYNSDVLSLQIALELLNQQNQNDRKTVILSDILQSGRDEDVLYREVADLLEVKHIDRLIGIGPAISRRREMFTMENIMFPSTEDFISSLGNLTFSDEAVLLKGARAFRFEQISERLAQNTHQTVMEINIHALINNLNVYREMLSPGTKTMVMVKAFSYGSGSYEIANALQFHKVDYLAVAYADEGITLRKFGITLPIMVLNPEVQAFRGIIRYGLEPEVFSIHHLDKLLQTIEVIKPAEPLPIHLMLDTGMHRLGIEVHDLPDLLKRLKESEGIRVASVFSHFAASDDPGEDAFTKKQISMFEEMAGQIQDTLGYKVLWHIANTGGIVRFPKAQYDMVRLGIGFYGVDVTRKVKHRLQVPSKLKTTISQIKNLKAGETVGYGRKGVVKKPMTTATIAIGYADGFNRLMSNGNGYVMIHGRQAPVVGDVCMDMTMVDITGIEAKEGDEVIVFGDEPSIEQLAKWCQTITYEILTNVSQRVKRVYYNE